MHSVFCSTLLHPRLIVFCARCARFAQDCTSFPDAQYMRKIVLLPSMRKIVVISSMRNICARFVQDCSYFPNAQDCTYFPNAQYMRKIALIFQCAIYAQDLRKICARLYLFLQCTYFPMCNICARLYLFSICNICARFVQDCIYFFNAQYMRKICARLCLTSNLKR